MFRTAVPSVGRAESTEISCDELRERCGIRTVLLPPHFYSEDVVDKWGNPVLPNGQRLKGELFHDESVQKVLAPVLHLFSDRVKHPRTHHLPWSPNVSSDDKIIPSLSGFLGQEVVITAKMDGELTSIYKGGFHARSIDTAPHPSRDWLWGLHRRIGHDIPQGWRICGENLYAKHSIRYRHLPAHFLVHSVWDDRNTCLSWRETMEWCELLGLCHVKILGIGAWDTLFMKDVVAPEELDGDPCEGYVVRVTRRFAYREFKDVVAKWVRKDHVQTHGHWMRQAVEVNGLAVEAP